MEKLYRESSDGSARTLSGDVGVQISRITRLLENGVRIFEFHPSATVDAIRVEWDGDIAVIPADIANMLLTANHARHASEFHIAAWNEVVDDFLEKKKEMEKKVAEEEAAAKALAQAIAEETPPPPAPMPKIAATLPVGEPILPGKAAMPVIEKPPEVIVPPEVENKATPLVPPKVKLKQVVAAAPQTPEEKADALAKAEAEAKELSNAKKSAE